jgi:hypothetical protein
LLLRETVFADLDVCPAELKRLSIDLVLSSLLTDGAALPKVLVDGTCELFGSGIEIEEMLHKNLFKKTLILRCPLKLHH